MPDEQVINTMSNEGVKKRMDTRVNKKGQITTQVEYTPPLEPRMVQETIAVAKPRSVKKKREKVKKEELKV